MMMHRLARLGMLAALATVPLLAGCAENQTIQVIASYAADMSCMAPTDVGATRRSSHRAPRWGP